MTKLGCTMARNSLRGRGKGDLKFSGSSEGDGVFVVQAVKDTSASGFSNHNRKDFFEFNGEKSCLGDFCMNPVRLLTLLFWKLLLE